MIFKTTPWRHQLKALEYLMPRNFGALYTDMGTGKTKIMLDLIVNRGWKKVLIICPKKVGTVWEKESKKHLAEGEYLVQILTKLSGADKVTLLKNSPKNDKQIVVINYDSVWREPFKQYILKNSPDCIICDESHRIKSAGSKVSKFLQVLGRRVPNRFLVTGTPLGQSPLDIYAQYRFLAPEIFGTSYGTFKNEYANWVQVPGGFSILDKKTPYKNLDKLHDKMFSCAFLAESDVELPETQDIILEFEVASKVEKYYEEMKKEGLVQLRSGVVETSTVLTLILRAQQLMNGYLPVETEEGVKILNIDSSRQDTLEELLEGLPETEAVVVFAKYRKDIKEIRNVVKKLGRKSSELSGVRDTLQNWLDGNTTVLVVQISSGAEGIDLTRARYCVYYSLGSSLIQYKQSRKRVHRPGQTRPVVYYTLVAKLRKGLSIDEKIVDSLTTSSDLIKSIMEDKSI